MSASQSATYKNRYFAKYAVDGVNNCQAAHSDTGSNQIKQWWMVDMKQLIRVRQVRLYGIPDCCGKHYNVKCH